MDCSQFMMALGLLGLPLATIVGIVWHYNVNEVKERIAAEQRIAEIRRQLESL